MKDDLNNLNLEEFAQKFTETLCANCVKNLMLTGGRTASQLYRILSANPKFINAVKGLQIFFTDERAVSPLSNGSNCKLVVDSFCSSINLNELSINRMHADDSDLERAAQSYEAILPVSLDIILLTLGDDGHIASLFPGSPALLEMSRKVIPVNAPGPYTSRITITPRVISNARNVFVLALGGKKRSIYNEALKNPQNVFDMPARLVLNRTWVFGDLIE